MKIKSRTRLDFRLYLPSGLEDAVSDLIGQVPGMVETISLKCALAARFLGGPEDGPFYVSLLLSIPKMARTV